MSEVTIVITSCGRPDLLEKTITSFLKHNTYPITQWIISEDSGIENVNKKLADRYSNFTWISAKERRGQIKSIDEAYALVKTEYVFHLEDDWETYADGAIAESLGILQSNEKISAVMCRAHGEGGYKMSTNPPFLDCWGIWGYYSFNPGLRRISDVKKLFNGSFSTFTSFDKANPLKSEIAINNLFRDKGYKMAMTSGSAGYLKHIGDGRHIGETISTTRKKIGLCMIVKDESHIIEETLQTIYPLIDCYAITDTGSTDNTIQLIETFFEKKGIPGKVFHDTWEDFGTNRSRALKNCDGLMDYIIVIDADDLMVFPSNGKELLLKMVNLDLNGLMMKIRQGDLEYDRMQIMKANDGWKYVGVLHEYPTNHKEGNRVSRIPGDFHMVSRRLGNRSKLEDKYKRDAEILEKALEKEPDNERYVFYLAQSYRDSGQVAKSVEMYKKRVEMGKWYEECAFSAYQVARMTNDKEWAWKAHELNPKRIESLCYYLAYCRLNNKWSQELYAMALHASTIKLSADQQLFVETDAYKWRALDELSIHAYWTNNKEKSLEASDKLLRDELFPEEHRLRIMTNRRLAMDTSALPPDIEQRMRVWKHVLKSISSPLKKQTVWANPSKFSITIVETKCPEDLQATLNNIAHVYGGTDVALYIFHGTQNRKFIKDITKNWLNVQYVSLGVQSLTDNEQSKLLTTASFWEKIKTKHTLVMNSDTLLLRKIPDSFFDYEFVGAPIHSKFNDMKFQRGAFSLRNVSAMKSYCEKDGPEDPAEHGGNGEDIFFSCRAKMPSFLQATEFCVELFFRKNPVGVSKPYLYNSVDNLLCLFSKVPGVIKG